MPPSVEILLATYNGAKYLSEQLVSLHGQTLQDWRLLISDDGSTDETLEILKLCQARFPEKLMILPVVGPNLGSCGNFNRLLLNATAPYVMFCDQDDVWLPHKIQVTLQKMKEMETLHGADKPLLVHTDLKVVDKDLSVIDPSLRRYQKLDPCRTTLNNLLVQNSIVGCTIMANRALCALSQPIPPEARMHDWWLALTAAAFGHIGYVDEQTVCYRQHGRNDSGAVKVDFLSMCAKLFDYQWWRQSAENRKNLFGHLQRQAKAFYTRYEPMLDARQKELLGAYSGLSKESIFGRCYRMSRYGFHYSDPWLTLAMLLSSYKADELQ